MGKISVFFLAAGAVASTGIFAINSEYVEGARYSKPDIGKSGSFDLNSINSQALPENIVLPKGVVGAVFNPVKTQSSGNS